MNLSSTMRKLLRKHTSARAASLNRKRVPRHALSIEALEDRTVLSTISMLPVGGGLFSLRINGDGKDNQIVVVDHGMPSSGLGDMLDIRIDQQRWSVENVVSIEISAGNGNDKLLVSGVFDALTSIKTNSGLGNDAIMFDQFSVGDRARPHLAVDTGLGDDLVSFRPIYIPSADFEYVDIAVLTGGGNDQVLLSDFHFNSTSTGTARLAIDTGGGDDLVAVTNWSITDPISEALSDDTPSAGEIEMSIATAAGNDQVLIGESKFQNLVLKVDTGAGNDSVPIRCDWFDGSSELSFSLATGDDALSLRENTFAAAVKLNVDAGAGNDFVAFLCDAVHDAAILSFSLGAGDDTLAVMQNSFGGSLKLTVNGGAGNDKVTIIGNSFKGSNPFDVRLGTGNDQSLIQEKSFDPKLDKLSALEQLRLKQAMERVSKLEKLVSNTQKKASASLAALVALVASIKK